MHKPGFLSQALCLATLAACAADAPTTYAGDLTPIAGACDPAFRAVLITRGRDVQFTPNQGVLMLPGQITQTGAITAATANPGADHKPYPLKLTATLSGATVAGAYVTPRCRYAVHLTRAD